MELIWLLCKTDHTKGPCYKWKKGKGILYLFIFSAKAYGAFNLSSSSILAILAREGMQLLGEPTWKLQKDTQLLWKAKKAMQSLSWQNIQTCARHSKFFLATVIGSDLKYLKQTVLEHGTVNVAFLFLIGSFMFLKVASDTNFLPPYRNIQEGGRAKINFPMWDLMCVCWSGIPSLVYSHLMFGVPRIDSGSSMTLTSNMNE